MKNILKSLEQNDPMGELDLFKANINRVQQALIGRFKDLQFFTGKSRYLDAMLCMCEYKNFGGEIRPVMIYFKHGLFTEELTTSQQFCNDLDELELQGLS